MTKFIVPVLWFGSLACGLNAAAQEPPALSAQATVRLGFEEADGPALDTATVGTSADNASLQNGATRVSSPFWNQSGHKAVQLDSTQQQFLEIADGEDVDRPDAVTFSLLTVNLLANDDAAFHGLVAKRGMQDGKVFTNYGINFTMQQDTFQVYINDGRGYRVVRYSTKAALPTRKLLHVTATFQVADAPGQDADTDVDDVRIQYFVNGQPLTPTSVTNGFVEGTSGWITDVEVAGLVNNLPVTLGRSEAGGEYYQGVIDEFLLFPKALTPEEVKQLFHEVAGSNVEQLIQDDQAAPAKIPDVARLTQPGFSSGSTTQVVMVGKNLLSQPEVIVPVAGVTTEIVGEPKDDRLTVKLTIADHVRPGFYPLYVRTANGISEPQPMAIDWLPHRNATEVTAMQPATLPAALFGTLAGGQEQKAYFQGTKGQRIVADLELKRLGGKANPVLELKTAQGTPITIAWGSAALQGDVRLEHRLPADGLYYVELHDLVYRAPGPNSYRLKLGDLKFVDHTFPPASQPGPLSFEPIGTGFDVGESLSADVENVDVADWAPVVLPRDSQVAGPWPYVELSPAQDVVETPVAEGQWQTVDAQLTDPQVPAVAIDGRLLHPGERDQYLLPVTSGQKLRFRLETQSLSSPVHGELEILGHPQGNRLAISGDQPSDADVTLDYTIPANMTQVRVAIRDLFNQGNPQSFYRLVIGPADRPNFSLSTTAATLQLPEQGTSLVEVTVNRAGYAGPIALSVAGSDSQTLTIEPTTIPAGVTGKVLCRIQQTAKPESRAGVTFKIVGSTVDVHPPLVRTASRADDGVLPAYQDALALGQTALQGLSLELLDPPAVLFKGAPQQLSLKVMRQADREVARQPVRITTRSTETVRQRQANNPGAGTFPVIGIGTDLMLAPETQDATVQLQVPLDVAEATVELAIVAEAVPHLYSDRVIGTAYSRPFRVQVQTAVAPMLEAATLTAKSETSHEVTGKLQRTAGFTGPVSVTLIGLPKGYAVQAAEVAGDQNDFKLIVTAPAVTAETAVANVKLHVTTSGSAIAADQDVALKVVPKE
ncbi:hypothetical protein GC163_15640 [bacterium]|nr:hypothetical protein [bacterium]